MKNAFSLAGRRILITGAAKGIGAATAHVCASLVAELVLLDIADDCAANGILLDAETINGILHASEQLHADAASLV